jgi:hypothetical protein
MIPKGFGESTGGLIAERLREEIELLVFAILSLANSIRKRIRFSIGDTPTVSFNLSTKVVRDMAARRASFPTVQSRTGSLFIHEIATLICLSDRAKNYPAPPLNPSARCRGVERRSKDRFQDHPPVCDERHEETQHAAHDDGCDLAVLGVHSDEDEALDHEDHGGYYRERRVPVEGGGDD